MGLETLAAIAAASGTVIKSYGTYAGLQAQAVQAKYEAQVGRSNIELRERKKSDIRLAGARAVKDIETDAIKVAGRQATAFASGGIDLSSQIVGEKLEETARVRGADIVELNEILRKQLWGEDIGILSERQQILMAQFRGKLAGQLAPITALSELFSGAGAAAIGGSS
jgi:hypothetical protein